LGIEYCIDIILLGRKLNKERVVLGAIEIENTHEAEFLKILICKSLGFPLMTIKINEFEESKITKELCHNLLMETTSNSMDLRRRNYLYIHNLLLPVFIKKPINFDFDDGHQYLVFFRNISDRERLMEAIQTLRNILDIDDKAILLQKVNMNKNDKSSITMIKNETQLISQNKDEYNIENYLRIVLPRPEHGENIYLFHMILSRLLALYFDCLVAYKYKRHYTRDENPGERIWRLQKFNQETRVFDYTMYCPKELSEPIFMIIEEIKKHSELFSQQPPPKVVA
jgi:hypothetical protein